MRLYFFIQRDGWHFWGKSRSSNCWTLLQQPASGSNKDGDSHKTEKVVTIKTIGRSFPLLPLKVVGNQKGGGSGGWLLFEDACDRCLFTI
jgi:hypothetical protein